MGGLLSTSTVEISAEDMAEIKKGIQDMINQNKVVIYSKTTCPYCSDAKKCFDKLNVKYAAVELNSHPQGAAVQDALHEITGARTVPRVFVNGTCIGGGSDTVQLFKNGELQKMLDN